jgi:hypothetical protein
VIQAGPLVHPFYLASGMLLFFMYVHNEVKLSLQKTKILSVKYEVQHGSEYIDYSLLGCPLVESY